MDYKEVLKTSQMADGSLRTVEVEGRVISLAQVGSTYFAFDDLCTHEECSLGTGLLDEKTIECPCHGSKFDLETGAVLNLPAVLPIKTYPVKVENGTVFVDVG